jgi:integral membrane protein
MHAGAGNATIGCMSAARTFRIAAAAEAVSWTGLLVGMLLKHPLDAGERGVQVFGPIHGAMFVAYVVAALVVSRTARWSPGLTLAALVASIPPLTTVLFERWATASGRLPAGERTGDGAPAPGTAR